MGPNFVQGDFLPRPPLFDGSNYTYWKQRMKCFVQSIDYRLWRVIVDGPQIPTKTENGEPEVKHETEWNEQDIKMVELNARAMNLMFCAVKPEEYAKLSRCNSAKEIWDKLQAVYEGVGFVRRKKMTDLLRDYERFEMRKNERIEDMYRRLSPMINNLDALGMTFSDEELVQKVLKILIYSHHWHSTAVPMLAADNLNHMTYDELRGDLIHYENTRIAYANHP